MPYEFSRRSDKNIFRWKRSGIRLIPQVLCSTELEEQRSVIKNGWLEECQSRLQRLQTQRRWRGFERRELLQDTYNLAMQQHKLQRVSKQRQSWLRNQRRSRWRAKPEHHFDPWIHSCNSHLWPAHSRLNWSCFCKKKVRNNTTQKHKDDTHMNKDIVPITPQTWYAWSKSLVSG